MFAGHIKVIDGPHVASGLDVAQACVCIWYVCIQARGGRCAKSEPSSYGFCQTKNKRCGSCTLTTKHVAATNYFWSQY